MKKLIVFVLAAAMLAAVQTAQAQTYSASTDVTITARAADTGAAIMEPAEVFLMVHEGTAVVSYEDAQGVHEFTGKAYETEDGGIIFAGLTVTMPAGDRLTFCFAEVSPERLEVVSHYAGERLTEDNAITFTFAAHNV